MVSKLATYKVIKNRKAQLRRRNIRRVLTLAIIVGFFVYAGRVTHANRLSRLESARLELNHYRDVYEDVMLRQGFYRNQLIRLDDEAYVLKFARERHFWSLPGEVIFRFTDPLDTPIEHQE